MDDNKENTLADAIAKIETLQAKNESLEADLATANSKIAELDDELSAALTALALLASYVEELRIGLVRVKDSPEITEFAKETIQKFSEISGGVESANLLDFMTVY